MEQLSELDILENMFVHFTYVANRECTPNWKFKGNEIFDKHNLILVYDGEAEITCNNRKYRISKGDLIYFKPHDFRLGSTFQDKLMKCFTVDFLYTCPVLKNNEWQYLDINLPFASVENIHDDFLFSRLIDLFSNFAKTWLSGNHNKMTRGRAMFMEILTLLFQWKFNDHFNYDKIRKIDHAINYMTEHYSSQIKLQEIADSLGISLSYFGNIFKEITGKPPIAYLIAIRINKAKDLLMDGFSVSDTAQMVGFNDIFYFSKCFKKHEGINPSQFVKIDI
ncbi:AraC family transcriptional regulator [Bacillus sp. USDA818B3_A]|uniref:AraC family transcriptional regulator n=1 Tax=Bacillus sp. USDA818B3_A TaxID=2698834 RepID=UPI00136E273B|nr:AraC family transcriptional regulator [Bacillus sp. USDA818B3_A]